jgi:hypothetical protein
MRLPRVRLTVRQLMIAVAVFAFSLEVGRAYRRSGDYRMQAWLYQERERVALRRARDVESGRIHLDGYTAQEKQRFVAQSRRFAAHAARMRAKYEWATYLPWLSVAPDPLPLQGLPRP